MEKTTTEQELRKFLQHALDYLENSQKTEDDCYMTLYHIKVIAEALKEGDENLATIISSWMADNKEKFHFCATEDDFYRTIGQIEMNTGRILDTETPSGSGTGIRLDKFIHYLNETYPGYLEKGLKRNI